MMTIRTQLDEIPTACCANVAVYNCTRAQLSTNEKPELSLLYDRLYSCTCSMKYIYSHSIPLKAVHNYKNIHKLKSVAALAAFLKPTIN